MMLMIMCLFFRLKSVVSFRAGLQYSPLSNRVRQLARSHHAVDVARRSRRHRTARRLTPPFTARDLHRARDFFSASTTHVAAEPRRLRSVHGRGDLRAAGLQNHDDESELWVAPRTVQTGGHVTSSEEDQTSKDDTEDELSK